MQLNYCCSVGKYHKCDYKDECEDLLGITARDWKKKSFVSIFDPCYCSESNTEPQRGRLSKLLLYLMFMLSVNHSNKTVNSFLFILSVLKHSSHSVFRWFWSYFSHRIWKKREGLEWRTEREMKDLWGSCNSLKNNLSTLRYNSKSLYFLLKFWHKYSWLTWEKIPS